MNAENPRSRVMPRSALCGCLSRAAVDSWVDRARTACRTIYTFTNESKIPKLRRANWYPCDEPALSYIAYSSHLYM